MRIEIYQIDTDANYVFRSLKFAKENNFDFKNDYKLIYQCSRPSDITLDDIFDEFNFNLPEDFEGHSLAVSDIINFNGDYYYCDPFGWSKLSQEELGI